MDMDCIEGMMDHFHFSTNVTILFDGWQVTTIPGLLGSCVFFILLAFAFEVLKTFRSLHIQQAATNIRHRVLEEVITEKSEIIKKQTEGEIGMLSWPHAIQSILHVVQALLGYILMLVVMTYNCWLVLSVLLGIGLGYFASAWKRTIVLGVQEMAKE